MGGGQKKAENGGLGNKTNGHAKGTEKYRNGQTDTKTTSDQDAADKDQRSFLQRNAYFITLMLYQMVSSLGSTVHSQFRYQFFHHQHSHELREFNVSRECGVELSPEVQAIENKISQDTARWSLYGHFATILPLIGASLVIGMKSDQIGRRFIFLFPIASNFINTAITAVIIRLGLHYGWTIIGSVFYSLAGGHIGMSFAAYAVISDTHGKKKTPKDSESSNSTTEKKPGQKSVSDEVDLDMAREPSRTFKIVLLTVLQRFSGSLIAFGTGYIIDSLGFFWTLIIVIGGKVLIFIFAFIFVTETGKQKKTSSFVEPLKTIGRAFQDPRRRVTLILVNLGLLFSILAMVEEYAVLHTYEMSPPFCLRAIQLGWLSSEGRIRGIFAIPLMWLWRRLRFTESTIAGIGMASSTAGGLLLATVRETWVFFADPVITIPSVLSHSMSKAITSRLIGRSALASTFAVMMAGEELFAFVGQTASNYLYQNTLDTVPTAPFYLVSCSFALASSLYFAQTIYQRRTSILPGEENTNVNTQEADLAKT